jgi:hypothetical protein
MKSSFVTIIITSAVAVSVAILRQGTQAQDTSSRPADDRSGTTTGAVETKTNNQKSSTFLPDIPPGYRDWRLISVAREEGDLDDIRAILGNEIAVRAYREGKLPFPEGAIIARLAWSCIPSEENNKAFGRHQSFVAELPKNGVQFMIKDSIKYAATGGWGYGHFNDGKPADEALLQSCYTCHQAVKTRDFVFTRYAP